MTARQSERVGTSLPVLIRTSGGGLLPGVVRNLGHRGLFIQTNRSLPINSQVVVTLDLSRRSRTPREHIAGTVIHDHNGGLGLRAENPEVSVRDVILHCAGQSGSDGPVSRWFVTDNSRYEAAVPGTHC